MILIFSILLALAVALLVVGIIVNQGGAGARQLAARLLGVSRRPEENRHYDVERDRRFSTLPLLDRLLRSLNLGQDLELLLYQGGLKMKAGMLLTLIAVAAVSGYLLGVAIFHRVFPGIVFMVALGFVPWCFVLYRKNKRMTAFSTAFPDAVDLLVSGLRAGLSFSAAMQIVAEESPEPVRGEFAITVEEQALGLDVRETMMNLTRRVEVMDLRFFVTAVLLQRETGGNLAEVLANSAALIRDRFRVLGDIRTFTAQGKMTAVILVALPVLVGVFTYIVTPDYFKPMLEDAKAQQFVWIAAFMQLAGCGVIYKIVNIKV